MSDLIVKMKFGSHMYGTNTAESDTDYKGIFLPTLRDVILGGVPKARAENTKADNNTKNTAMDVDVEIYSLQYFIELACKGETVALDMLHAQDEMIAFTTSIWKHIVDNRWRFYTKNLKAYVGYARKQAAKYGIKGSRLHAIKLAMVALLNEDPDSRLSAGWDRLPEGEFLTKHPGGIMMYEVCGRKFPETARVAYVTDIIGKLAESYGARAAAAERNEGIDWKAVSHALRAGFQVRQLLTEGTITFPLREATYLKKVKQGELNYLTDVAPYLDMMIDDLDTLSARSSLPDKPDKTFWDDFIVELYS